MASSPSPPKPVDPNTIINAQEAANRVNRVTPFGSQSYDKDGNLTTSLSPQTQTAFDNVAGMAGNKQQLIQNPSGFGDLQQAMLTKALGNAGASGNAGAPGATPKGGGAQMPNIGAIDGQQTNPAWQAALGKIWGGQ